MVETLTQFVREVTQRDLVRNYGYNSAEAIYPHFDIWQKNKLYDFYRTKAIINENHKECRYSFIVFIITLLWLLFTHFALISCVEFGTSNAAYFGWQSNCHKLFEQLVKVEELGNQQQAVQFLESSQWKELMNQEILQALNDVEKRKDEHIDQVTRISQEVPQDLIDYIEWHALQQDKYAQLPQKQPEYVHSYLQVNFYVSWLYLFVDERKAYFINPVTNIILSEPKRMFFTVDWMHGSYKNILFFTLDWQSIIMKNALRNAQSQLLNQEKIPSISNHSQNPQPRFEWAWYLLKNKLNILYQAIHQTTVQIGLSLIIASDILTVKKDLDTDLRISEEYNQTQTSEFYIKVIGQIFLIYYSQCTSKILFMLFIMLIFIFIYLKATLPMPNSRFQIYRDIAMFLFLHNCYKVTYPEAPSLPIFLVWLTAVHWWVYKERLIEDRGKIMSTNFKFLFMVKGGEAEMEILRQLNAEQIELQFKNHKERQRRIQMEQEELQQPQQQDIPPSEGSSEQGQQQQTANLESPSDFSQIIETQDNDYDDWTEHNLRSSERKESVDSNNNDEKEISQSVEQEFQIDMEKDDSFISLRKEESNVPEMVQQDSQLIVENDQVEK